MTISVATSIECIQLTLSNLHLDATGSDFTSPEALAGSLRRAASFQCPTTPQGLIDSVLEVLQPLYSGTALDRQDVADMLEKLVSAGDLVELPPDSQRRVRLLYLAPPSFVEQRPGRYLVMGIRPFGAPLLGSDLERTVLHERHVRSVELGAEGATPFLRSLGLHPIKAKRWVSAPATEHFADIISSAGIRLGATGIAGNIASLRILDPTTSPGYYKGRWRSVVSGDNGDFIARRPQEYGSDLWCYVRIVDGVPERLMDFPISDPTVPGRDEAWRLQAAIDANQQNHQFLRIDPNSDRQGSSFVDFFSPIPTWTERYLELIGTAVTERRKCLFSYLVPDANIQDVVEYLKDMLWMLEEVARSKN